MVTDLSHQNVNQAEIRSKRGNNSDCQGFPQNRLLCKRASFCSAGSLQPAHSRGPVEAVLVAKGTRLILICLTNRTQSCCPCLQPLTGAAVQNCCNPVALGRPPKSQWPPVAAVLSRSIASCPGQTRAESCEDNWDISKDFWITSHNSASSLNFAEIISTKSEIFFIITQLLQFSLISFCKGK